MATVGEDARKLQGVVEETLIKKERIQRAVEIFAVTVIIPDLPGYNNTHHYQSAHL